MKKIAQGIVRLRKLILTVAVLLLIPSAIGAIATRINYDILTYLPQDLDSMIGEVALEDDFHLASTGMITVEGLPTNELIAMKKEIEAVPGVTQTFWLSDVIDPNIPTAMLPADVQQFMFGKNDSTMLIVRFDAPSASDETMEAVKQIEKLLRKDCFFGGMSVILQDTKALVNQEMPLYILIAVGASLLVLFLSLESTLTPLLFMLGLPYESYIANRDAVLVGFKIAKEFLLRDQCVFRQRDLPYTTQLIPLAAICAVLGKSKCNEPNTIKTLSRWYWCGILGEMYGGANETRYAYDIEDMVEEVNGRPNAMHTINSAVFSSTRLLTLQTRLSAAYKGIMALLYKEKCRDFMNNTTIDIVNSMLESPDIHHIFPEAYCEKMGIKRERYNSIINKTPILPATNRSIGGNAPSEYLGAILKKVDGLNEDELQARVESHFIDYSELKADNFNGYFIDRAKSLLNLIEKAMNKPVTDRDAENTLDQFGASLA